jgi:UDP-N-acetylglucosamine--N-acetylmuramyl-(pentapeptide) pyrophosphoryl-undecaprenol N-acetylglucosamine transferase
MKPTNSKKNVLIMAGGTGGHIFPALVVAERLQAAGFNVYWLGSKGGLEEQLVAPHYPICYLSIKGIRGKGIVAKFHMLLKTVTAIWHSRRIIRDINPVFVLGMGGFASGPGGFAAWLMRKPLIIHEQNAKAGFTNRFLAKMTKNILAAFPEAFSSSIHAHVVGNPIRSHLFSIAPPKERWAERNQATLKILILGGSQGSFAINRAILNALPMFADVSRLAIWHQTGKQDYPVINQEWQKEFSTRVASLKVEPFIENMAEAYAWADLVIARSGALTVTEIATVGVASVLIPLPQAVDNHQFYNAQYLEKVDAAVIIQQANLTPERLCKLWTQFLDDRECLVDMAIRAKSMAKPKATDEVLAVCLKAVKLR